MIPNSLTQVLPFIHDIGPKVTSFQPIGGCHEGIDKTWNNSDVFFAHDGLDDFLPCPAAGVSDLSPTTHAASGARSQTCAPASGARNQIRSPAADACNPTGYQIACTPISEGGSGYKA